MIVRKDLVPSENFTGRISPVLLLDRPVMYLPEAEIEVETPFFSGKLRANCMKDPLIDLVIGNVEGLSISISWVEMTFRPHMAPDGADLTKDRMEAYEKDDFRSDRHRPRILKDKQAATASLQVNSTKRSLSWSKIGFNLIA